MIDIAPKKLQSKGEMIIPHGISAEDNKRLLRQSKKSRRFLTRIRPFRDPGILILDRCGTGAVLKRQPDRCSRGLPPRSLGEWSVEGLPERGGRREKKDLIWEREKRSPGRWGSNKHSPLQ